jgi:hypothetical protein
MSGRARGSRPGWPTVCTCRGLADDPVILVPSASRPARRRTTPGRGRERPYFPRGEPWAVMPSPGPSRKRGAGALSYPRGTPASRTIDSSQEPPRSLTPTQHSFRMIRTWTLDVWIQHNQLPKHPYREHRARHRHGERGHTRTGPTSATPTCAMASTTSTHSRAPIETSTQRTSTGMNFRPVINHSPATSQIQQSTRTPKESMATFLQQHGSNTQSTS